MVSLNKRTSMALFSDPTDHYCQRVRIVLEEKGISSEVIDTDNFLEWEKQLGKLTKRKFRKVYKKALKKYYPYEYAAGESQRFGDKFQKPTIKQ